MSAWDCVDRQIPKKPTEKPDPIFRYGKCYYCPVCVGSLATNEDDSFYNYWLSYCDNCGQKIDLSEVSE